MDYDNARGETPMEIIVAGCGKVGTMLISSFLEAGHEVTAIDTSNSMVTEIDNIYDVLTVNGNATDKNVLEEARVETADLFVAVTGSDELNMLSCYLARKLGAKHTIARIRDVRKDDQSIKFLKQTLNLSLIINPEKLAAREAYRVLKMPGAIKVETFSRNTFEMVEIRLKPESKMSGKTVAQARNMIDANFIICVVQRGDNVFIPNGSFVLEAGDRVGISASVKEINKFFREVGNKKKEANNTMILGGSKVSYYLAKLLLEGNSSVKIIDQDIETCNIFCDAFPKATVIHGDGAQQEVLLEEGLRDADAFVALTGIDEENILISKFAETEGVPNVIAKVNRDELAAMAENIGLECVVSPKQIAADTVLRYARALHNTQGTKIETLYRLMDGSVEAIEFIVGPEFKHAGTAIKDLSIKKNILIAGIIRNREAIIPSGDDVILEGDSVVVIVSGGGLTDLSDTIS